MSFRFHSALRLYLRFSTFLLTLMLLLLTLDLPQNRAWHRNDSATFRSSALAEARIKVDNVGQTAVIDRIHWKAIWAGVLNPVTVASSVIFLFDNIVVQGVSPCPSFHVARGSQETIRSASSCPL